MDCGENANQFNDGDGKSKSNAQKNKTSTDTKMAAIIALNKESRIPIKTTPHSQIISTNFPLH